MDEQPTEDILYQEFEGMAAISIIIDNGSVRADLGTVPPMAAITVLEYLADHLRGALVPPSVTYLGEEILCYELIDPDDD